MYSPFIVDESRERYQVQIQTADEYRLAQQSQPANAGSPRTGLQQRIVTLWQKLETRLARVTQVPPAEEIW